MPVLGTCNVLSMFYKADLSYHSDIYSVFLREHALGVPTLHLRALPPPRKFTTCWGRRVLVQ